jgi:hypothetical protein
MKKCILINSGNKSNECGTGFMISKKLTGSIIEYKLINESICTIRMRSRFFNIPYISVQAPSEEEEKEDTIKAALYEKLENTYNQIPRSDVKIILHDFNAKIGREEQYKSITEEHSKHNVSNNNGLRVIDVAAGKNTRICSTFFLHSNIHKETWISPDGTTRNQTDHIIIDARHTTDMLVLRSYRGANCNTDHFLVRAKMRQRIMAMKQRMGKKN